MRRTLRKIAACLTAAVICTLCFVQRGMQCPDDTDMTAYASAYIPGIDVSKFQEKIDWEAAAAYGEKFAIIRCCKIYHAYGDREYDERFMENYEGARAAGLAVGCYLFTDAVTSAEFKQDVEMLLSHIDGLDFEFPVYLDIESKTRQEHLPSSVFTPPLIEALEMIEQAGHTAGVYANTAFFAECIDREEINARGYEIWEANYFDSVSGLASPAGHNLSESANIWQYTGCGRTGGVPTMVDRNICYTYKYFDHRISLENAVLPDELLHPGTDFRVQGSVQGDAIIRTLTGTITNRDTNEPVQTVTVYPHAKSYDINGFFSKKLAFSSLPEGRYVMRINAVDSSGKNVTVADSEFTVQAETTTAVTTADPFWGSLTTGPDGDGAMAEAVRTLKSSMSAAEATTVSRPTEPMEREEPETGSTFLRTALTVYESLGVRQTLNDMKEKSTSLALERTPLHRIISSASDRADALYTAAGLLTGRYT